jgi:hypothetical protein
MMIVRVLLGLLLLALARRPVPPKDEFAESEAVATRVAC